MGGGLKALADISAKNVSFFDGSAKGSRKKNPALMARPLRPYPPPLELNGHRNFFF